MKVSKSFVAGAVVGLAASCAVAFGSASANHNGIFWNKLSRTAKDGYVNGYVDAMTISVLKLNTLIVAGDLFHWRGSRKVINGIERQLSRSEIKSGEVVHHLNTLYKNQKYMDIDLGTALQLIEVGPAAIETSASPDE